MLKRFRSVLLVFSCACGVLCLAGCGVKRVPVAGKVMIGAAPLKGGAACFEPDTSKGNKARVTCVGRIGPDGQYSLVTTGVTKDDSGPGVPVGWYKVWIRTVLPGQTEPVAVNPKYTTFDATPLEIE